MKKIILLMATSVILVSCGVKSVEEDVIRAVKTVKLEEVTLEKKVSYQGVTEAIETSYIVDGMNSKVTDVYVEIGDDVEEDEKLFRIKNFQTGGEKDILSKVDGIVSNKNIKVDSIITGAIPPMIIMNVDDIVLKVNVTESFIDKINKEDEVDVKIDDKNKKGKIKTISPVGNHLNMYEVEIKVENKNHEIKVGMFGSVEFVVDRAEEVIAVPSNTVLTREDEKYVFIEEEGKAKKKVVTVGLRVGKDVEIIEGLEVEDRLIYLGHNYVEDKEYINVINEIEEE